jgi:predicted DNA-binding transcriptional regulator YafY
MSLRSIYTEDGLAVEKDLDDNTVPVKIQIENEYVWLTVEEAREVIAAIEEAAGLTKEAQKATSEASENASLLQVAALHGRTVEFRYAKGSGDVIETRRLVPGKLDQVGEHLTVTGYDPDRDEPRAYRLDRIKGTVSVV